RPTSQTSPPITSKAKCEPLRYRGPDWMPITPKTGSLFHAETQLRKIAARSVEALWTAIGDLVDTFAPDECRNYLRHSGYGRSA
ncbi:MAG: hypothetical protein WBP94_14185, partial [Rhodomicrobiaceae bacterium]